uniref:Mitochondrial inner membrane protease subunit 2 n=1 Tax=Zonotrichia albicollis TaxID=44394 RepID=A0A8D2MGK7_ZONAL
MNHYPLSLVEVIRVIIRSKEKDVVCLITHRGTTGTRMPVKKNYDPSRCQKSCKLIGYRSPRNPEQKIIKRVIALEGDIIKTIGYKKKYVKVPHGHIWVEGDHHGHSFDSNAFGPVSLGLLHGRATHILWPPQRWQKLQPMLPPERKPLLREQE